MAKPDRRIFEAALSTAGARADQSTMLGDSWSSDVLGAEGAGIRPVWFNRFGLPRPAGSRATELRSLRPLRPAEETLLGSSFTRGGEARASGSSAL